MDKKNVKNELERVLYSILWAFVNHENVLPNLFVEGFTIYAKILTSHIEYKIEIIIKNNDLKKSMSMIFLHPGYERLNVDNETWVKAAIAELIYNMKEKSLFLEDEIEKPISFIEYQHLKTFITKIFELFCEIIHNFTIKEQDSESYRYFNLPLLKYSSREFCIANYHITARICLDNSLEFFSYKGDNKDINCRLSFKKPMFRDTDLKIWVDNSIRHVLVEILSLETHNHDYAETIVRSFEPAGLFYDYCVNDVESITNMIKYNIDNTCMMNKKLKSILNMQYGTKGLNLQRGCLKPELCRYKKIIFDPPTTIVQWFDGTESVVNSQNVEDYDPEKGIALCFMKKYLGNDDTFNKILNKEIKMEMKTATQPECSTTNENFKNVGEKLSNVISNMIQNSSILKGGSNNVKKKKK